MKISTGQPEDHPTPLPLDASTHPGVQAPAAIASSAMVQGGVADTGGMFASQAAAGEAAAAAAMTSGMAADGARRAGYEASLVPLGADYGDTMALPQVPEQATTPASGFLYGQGDQPSA